MVYTSVRPASPEIIGLREGVPENHPMAARIGKYGLRICDHCQGHYPALRENQKFCNDECYKAYREPNKKICPNPDCPQPGRLYTPKRPDQECCGRACSNTVRSLRNKGKLTTKRRLEDLRKDSERYHFEQISQVNWTVRDLWFWFCHQCQMRSICVELNPDKVGWNQLQILHTKILRHLSLPQRGNLHARYAKKATSLPGSCHHAPSLSMAVSR